MSKAVLYFRVFLILDCRVDIFAALSRRCPALSYTTPVPPPKVRTDPRALFETLYLFLLILSSLVEFVSPLRLMSLLLSLQGPTKHNNVSAACQELPRKYDGPSLIRAKTQSWKPASCEGTKGTDIQNKYIVYECMLKAFFSIINNKKLFF